MEEKKKKSKKRETIESLLVALAVALVIRSFVIEPFKIPSTSMLPTLLVGDHIFVNRFVYGLRIPLTQLRIWEGREPRRGEVAIFLYPEDKSKDFIKRVVGLPGDKVEVRGHDLWVNGALVPKESVALHPEFSGWQQFDYFKEVLGKAEHVAQYSRYVKREEYVAVVPPGHYFVMGDNRDFSSDSREWGFVPRKNLKGRAMFIWLSWNNEKWGIRLHRFGDWIY